MRMKPEKIALSPAISLARKSSHLTHISGSKMQTHTHAHTEHSNPTTVLLRGDGADHCTTFSPSVG